MATTTETKTMTTDKHPSRMSTYSTAPTLTPSIAPSHITSASQTSSTPTEKASPLAQEMKNYSSVFARLDHPKLQSQRYEPSETKKDEIDRLALGAKLERALGRRMTGQDACFSSGAGSRATAASVKVEEKA